MNQIIQEITNIITNPPGNLTYHMVLAFSIVGALLVSFNHWRATKFPQSWRAVLGLSLMLGLRFLLFILAGIAWQGLVNNHAILPPLDRAVTLLGIILAIWIWSFPEPSRRADTGTLILVLLAITAYILNLIWWLGNNAQFDYNTSYSGQVGEITTAVISILGIILLVIRKPHGWGLGAAMLGLLTLGHLFAQLLPIIPGDFQGLVRLTQMAAYPLLLALPSRFPLPESLATASQPQERRRYGTDPQLLEDYLGLIAGLDREDICPNLIRTVSRTMLADVGLLVSPPDSNREMLVHCGYDLIREQTLPGFILSGQLAPLVASALSQGLPLRLPASSTSSDLKAFADGFNLPHPGHLLAVPILDRQGSPLFGLFLLSPHSERGWTSDDQLLLTKIAGSVAHLLQPDIPETQTTEPDDTRQILQAALTELDELRKEKDILLNQLEIAAEAYDGDQPQVENLADMITAQEQTQEIITNLQAENEHLRQSLLSATQPVQGDYSLAEQPTISTEPKQIEAELRLALQELASLKNAISQADQRHQTLKAHLDSEALPNAQIPEIADIVQDMRQPLSSIVGYCDFLLGETVGILGNMQRKFLERVKMSSERMNQLVEELIQVTGLENGSDPTADSLVSPIDLIDTAIERASAGLREKNIILRVDLPEELPPISANSATLGRALVGLLQNAGDATAAGGEISLRARLEGDQYQDQYLLIQVSDQGGGIPPEHLTRLFSQLANLDGTSIPGTSPQNFELPIVKVLVENMGGRIWVDSTPGVGSIFSVLLPVSEDDTMEIALPEDGLNELEFGGLPE